MFEVVLFHAYFIVQCGHLTDLDVHNTWSKLSLSNVFINV